MLSNENFRFYGRRVGKKLKASRQSLLENLLPKIAITKDQLNGLIKPHLWFASTPREFWLEVGFGGGEHTAEQALKNPEVGIIATEVFINGIASLLAHINGSHHDGQLINNSQIADNRKDNIRIFADDARLLLPFLPDNCLAKIFLLFPDPWPKKKHASRRFVNSQNLPEIIRLLKPGGEFRIASDNLNYIRWSLEHLIVNPNFDWLAESPKDWQTPPLDWIPTRYEQKALAQGLKPVYLRFMKKSG